MKIARRSLAYAALSLALIAGVAFFARPSPFVHADGEKLRRGWTKFEVRGAALMDDSTLWDPAKTSPDPGKIDGRSWAFSALGEINTVRLALKADYFIDDRGAPREEGFAFLEGQLSAAARLGLLVLIDMHIPAGGGVQDYRESPEARKFWESDDLKERFVKGWREIASRHRDDRRIMGYELMNEPAGEPEAYWELMKKTAGAIREVDQNHLLVLQPASDGVLQGVGDKNVAYSAHLYTPLSFTHQNVPWERRFSSTRRVIYPGVAFDLPQKPTFCDEESLKNALKRPAVDAGRMKAPLILGEFGVSTSADEVSTAMWIADALKAVEELGLAGYIYWRQIDHGEVDLSLPRNTTMAIVNADGSYFSEAQFFGIRPGFAKENPGFDGRSFYLSSAPVSSDKPLP